MGKRNADRGYSVTRDEVLRLYVGEGLTRREVARRLGIPEKRITAFFAGLDIPRKYSLEALWLKISRDELGRLYVDEGYPISKLVRRLGVTKGRIKRGLESIGIQSRAKLEALEVARRHGHLAMSDLLAAVYNAEQKRIALERAARIAADWKTGLYSRQALAVRHEVSLTAVYRDLRGMDVDSETVMYRNRAMVERHKEGSTVEEVASDFNVSLRVVKGVLREAGQSWARPPEAKPLRFCPVCGGQVTTNRPETEHCGQSCHYLSVLVGNLDRYLAIREARRGGEARQSIARRFGISLTYTSTIYTTNPDRYPLVTALEALFRYSQSGALTMFTRQEVRRAWRHIDGLGIGKLIERKYDGKVRRL